MFEFIPKFQCQRKIDVFFQCVIDADFARIDTAMPGIDYDR